jgi:hypothetical protein
VNVNDGKRPAAAFVIVQNEPVWLPIWFDYYSKHVGARNVFVLDHDSTDTTAIEAVAARGANVVPVHREFSYDHRWLRDIVERFQAFLLKSYTTVLFAEVDEFLISTMPGGLSELLFAVRWNNSVRAEGYNVVHYKDEEPPLNWTKRPLLAQRKYWHPSLMYSKTVIARQPLYWTPGFHHIQSGDGPTHPNLFLAHLHRIDWTYVRAKHEEQARRKWNDNDRFEGAGVQNRIIDDAGLTQYFYHDADLGPRENIPELIQVSI